MRGRRALTGLPRNPFVPSLPLSTDLDNAGYERGGFWRRALALLIDAIAVALIVQLIAYAAFPLSHGRVQYVGGFGALTCNKLEKVLDGVSVPDDFAPTSINDCRYGLFGLTSGRNLLITRTNHDGPIVTTRQIAHMLDTEGRPIEGVALNILLVPLLLALRFAFDLGHGSPGRRICRVRLASTTGAERPSAARLCRRYLVQFAPLLFAAVCDLGIGVFPEGSIRTWVHMALLLPTLALAIEAIVAMRRRKEACYDRFAGTCVLRVDRAGDPIAAVVVPPLPDAAVSFADAVAEPVLLATAASEPDAIEDQVSALVGTEFGEVAAAPSGIIPRVTALPPPLPSQNYFLRHWRGELSLPVACWVNGVVFGFACGFVIGFVDSFIYRGSDGRPVLWLSSLIVIWLGTILLTAWQSIGVWRSADQYRQSGKFFWGTAAQVMVVLGTLQFAYRLTTVGLPQIAGMIEIVSGDSGLGPHQFRVAGKGTVLEFSGGITFGVAKEMEGFLAAMENVRWVRLNSIGGRILEAQKMSDLIKARGLITVVGKDCLSACTVVFLGGKERWIGPNGRLGFHQVAFRGMTVADRRASIAREEARLQKLGLSRDFAERANKAVPSSMWFPDKEELLREHVVTRILTPPPKPATEPPPVTASPPSPVPADTRAASADAPVPATGAAVAPAAMIPPDVVMRLKDPSRWTAVPSSQNP
jgi:uncharacterized RDD family membrane protein YckC